MRFYTFLLFLIQTIYLFGQSKPPSEENLEKLNALVTKLDSKGFYGTILVAHKDSILFAKGYGFRDAAKQLPNLELFLFKQMAPNKNGLIKESQKEKKKRVKSHRMI